MNTKKIIGIGMLVVAVVGVGYFLMKKKKDSGTGSTGSTGSMGSDATPTVTAVNPKLNWLRNKAAASYLSSVLDDAQMTKLQGWVSLIEREKAKDSTKWKENSGGLKGQLSDVGHALYQMKAWDNDILAALKSVQ
ncbi:MAG: hypothetical protein ACXAAH_15860 [Promethearchaeota archaeon]|jgi:hypothetical protein